MLINAIQIYRSAVYMLKGISPEVKDRDPGGPEALASIIYAAISLETFINELPAVMASLFLQENSPPWLKTYVDVLDQLEQSKAQINTKYLLSKFILSGSSFDTGQNPYQNFDLLVRLRNEIVHQKPDDWRFAVDEKGAVVRSERQILKKLRSLNVLGLEWSEAGEEDDGIENPWIDRISTPGTAKWACESALSMILEILGAIPQGTVKDFIDPVYRSELTRIWNQYRASDGII